MQGIRMLAIFSSMALYVPNTACAEQPDIAPVQSQGNSNQAGASPTSVPVQFEPLKPRILSTQPQARDGFHVGSFLVNPEVTLSELYDDNIYASRTNEVRDWITNITPAVSIKSTWARHSLNFWAGTDINRYHSHTSENVVDQWLEAEGRYDISQNSNIYGGAGISKNHEDRSSQLDPAYSGAEPTRYWQTSAHLGTFHRFGKWGLRLGATYEHLDFNNVPAIGGGVISMDIRDRKSYAIGGRATYLLSGKYETFFQAATDTRRYDLSTVGRDSDGYTASVGFGLNQGGGNVAEVYVGILSQNYKNPLLKDVTKPYFGASAKFATGPATYVTAFLDRELGETTITGASSYLDTTAGARVDYDVNSNFSLNGRLGLTRTRFQGIDRNESYLDSGFGTRYYVRKYLYLGADYRLTLRSSSVSTPVVNGSQRPFDFARNQLMFTVGYTPGRTPRPAPVVGNIFSSYLFASADKQGISIPAEGYDDFSGFYAGLEAGHGSLNSEIFSARTTGGTDTMDMGKIGSGRYGVFAGYGEMRNRWYYGLELDATQSNAGWYHQKTKPDARTMSLDQDASYSAGLRLGHVIQGGLLYGHLGLVRANFQTYDTENQFAATGAYDRSQGVNGKRIGLGADIPAGDNLFVRLEYSYTAYDHYNTISQGDTGLTVDQFDNSDSLFQLGLGWRFGSRTQHAMSIDPRIADGFYAGTRLDHGSLSTLLNATHMDNGGTEGPFDFTGDFGKSGVAWGVFGGYGRTIDSVYLGIDLEAESSDVGWYNDRNPGGSGGRAFSVDRKGGVGASLRAGYVLKNGSLLYARAGKTRTRFNTIYNKGGNSASWVDRDDWLTGNLVGVGAELPVFRNLYVQMDYSLTRYKPYGFTTIQNGGANPDITHFKNMEDQFGLGIGMRF